MPPRNKAPKKQVPEVAICHKITILWIIKDTGEKP
ncbi:MAG: hypothetical protein ACJAT2_000723 [Bacteriovoracaceae bacterium]|jgi:hypothetical protein